MVKKTVFPPVKFFIDGCNKEITVEEARTHVKRISSERLKNKNQKGA